MAKLAKVRGEIVVILSDSGEPTQGVLGATVEGASILVEYPDGETGYVRASDIDYEEQS